MEEHEVGKLEDNIAEEVLHDGHVDKEMTEVDENDNQVWQWGAIDNSEERSTLIGGKRPSVSHLTTVGVHVMNVKSSRS